jgi:hypothetical protein
MMQIIWSGRLSMAAVQHGATNRCVNSSGVKDPRPGGDQNSI